MHPPNDKIKGWVPLVAGTVRWMGLGALWLPELAHQRVPLVAGTVRWMGVAARACPSGPHESPFILMARPFATLIFRIIFAIAFALVHSINAPSLVPPFPA